MMWGLLTVEIVVLKFLPFSSFSSEFHSIFYDKVNWKPITLLWEQH